MNDDERHDVVTSGAGLANMAEFAASASPYEGDILRFSKGRYEHGSDAKELPLGTRLVAVMDELRVGWTRWWDERPDTRIFGRVIDGFKPPRRDTLGDDSEAKWQMDADARARDPWRLSTELPLYRPASEEVFVFTASSRGGQNAIGKLAKAYIRSKPRRGDKWPVIELGADSYQHSNRSFGRIDFPVFTVVGWVAAGEISGGGSDDRAPAAEKPRLEAVADPLALDDVVPW